VIKEDYALADRFLVEQGRRRMVKISRLPRASPSAQQASRSAADLMAMTAPAPSWR
jgi:hypothetical protein